MSTAVLPRPSESLRLAPQRPRAVATRWRVLVAVGVALALHVVGAALLLVHPPAFLAPAPPPVPKRQAEIEMIENDMPTSGDQPIGGTGKDNAHQDAAKQGAPPPQPNPAAPPPPPSPNLPVASNGETPPPLAGQPQDRPTPATPPSPRQQNAKPMPPAPLDTPNDTPAIRLSDADETEGLSGGSAETPAVPDPKVRNKLPAYPEAAADRREHGLVQMIVHVAPDGTPAAVVVSGSSGAPELDTAAVRAVQRWRFKPAKDAQGQPVTSDVPVQLNFVLR